MGTRVFKTTSNVFTYAIYIRATLILGIPFLYVLFTTFMSTNLKEPPAHGRRLLSSKWIDEESFERNCTPAAINDFPQDLFTDGQRRQGAAMLHALLALYLFILLATACDHYFVPAIERMIQVLQVSDDVGGATLMAAATSSPELFINVVGTFVTEGDLGVGAVLGSAVFNILAVPAFCGIFANKEILLDWWPMTRDCGVYVLSVIGLIVCISDEMVFWYEALALVICYFFYILLMYNNVAVSRWARQVCTCWSHAPEGRTSFERTITPELSPLLLSQNDKQDSGNGTVIQVKQDCLQDSLLSWLRELRPPFTDEPRGASSSSYETDSRRSASSSVQSSLEEGNRLMLPRVSAVTAESSVQSSSSDWRNCTWWKLITAPIHLLLWLTIPDCEKHSRLYPLTFMMCIAWIGTSTYLITWMITVIGDTLRIPDSVMGITFLAAGTSVPEAVSSVIVTRQGHGGMGISNSIGSNTFDILLCLGLPWLIKSSMLALAPAGDPGSDLEMQHRAVMINSHGLEYSAISLLSSTLLLYITFSFYKFRLNNKVGVACIVLYAFFLCLASTLELNVFFTVNLPTCGR